MIFSVDLMGISESSELNMASISVGKHDWAVGDPKVRGTSIFQRVDDDFMIERSVMTTIKGKHFDLYHYHTLYLPCFVYYEDDANKEDKMKGAKWTKNLPKADPNHWQEGQHLLKINQSLRAAEGWFQNVARHLLLFPYNSGLTTLLGLMHVRKRCGLDLEEK